MTEASFASLNPTLLARKGGAKPAMRPQLAPIPDTSPANLEDLGWNDMGQDDDTASGSADVVQLAPAVRKGSSARQQQKLLVETIKQDNAPDPRAKPRKRAVDQGKRAAFTLRLDAERHLKLRLAATMQECSAQQLVTDALDALLDNIEELESLAAKMKRK